MGTTPLCTPPRLPWVRTLCFPPCAADGGLPQLVDRPTRTCPRACWREGKTTATPRQPEPSTWRHGVDTGGHMVNGVHVNPPLVYPHTLVVCVLSQIAEPTVGTGSISSKCFGHRLYSRDAVVTYLGSFFNHNEALALLVRGIASPAQPLATQCW